MALHVCGHRCFAFVKKQSRVPLIAGILMVLCFDSVFPACWSRRPDAFPRTAGSKRAPAPAPRYGGDDLEDDGYYDPEDVPDQPFEADGTEDQFGAAAAAAAPVTGRARAAAAAKKKSKVVVF